LKRTMFCAAAGMAAALVLAAPAGAANWTAGAPTSGDPFFAQMGNGGYDVQHYSLELDYDPATQVLDGSTRITLVPTQDLDQFNLDLRDWFGVSRVAVGKHPAAYFQEDEQELVITPRPKLHAGRSYTIEIDYAGVPETVVDPDDSFEGWVKNPDGAFVVNEPQGSPGWYPVNDPKTRVDEADPPNPTLAFERLDAQPEIVAFFSDLYGAYPFSAGGGIIDWAPDVGYALESQTRTNYDRIPDATTVVHELATSGSATRSR
jgi:hypothetical protein